METLILIMGFVDGGMTVLHLLLSALSFPVRYTRRKRLSKIAEGIRIINIKGEVSNWRDNPPELQVQFILDSKSIASVNLLEGHFPIYDLPVKVWEFSGEFNSEDLLANPTKMGGRRQSKIILKGHPGIDFWSRQPKRLFIRKGYILASSSWGKVKIPIESDDFGVADIEKSKNYIDKFKSWLGNTTISN
jgi:hypothetical protein